MSSDKTTTTTAESLKRAEAIRKIYMDRKNQSK